MAAAVRLSHVFESYHNLEYHEHTGTKRTLYGTEQSRTEDELADDGDDDIVTKEGYVVTDEDTGLIFVWSIPIQVLS